MDNYNKLLKSAIEKEKTLEPDLDGKPEPPLIDMVDQLNSTLGLSLAQFQMMMDDAL